MLDTWPMDEGLVDLPGMVDLHLSTNFYPGFPPGWVEGATPLVVEALNNVSNDERTEVIEWPLELQPYPRGGEPDFDSGFYLVPSYAVVEATKTYGMIP